MSEIIIDTNNIKQDKGLNKYNLLQSQSDDIRHQYNEVFELVQGSLTTVTDNDAQSKFNVAISILEPTAHQTETLIRFRDSFKNIEAQIDPERLRFEVDKAADNEICIYRKSINGVTNIIINDDGSIAFSFIAYKDANKNDVFDFYDNCDQFDYESLVFKFFSL